MKESQQASLAESYKERGLINGQQQNHQSKLIEIFQYYLDSPVLFISFSQRKFLGFRNKFEFDRKRVLIGSKSAFAIIAYDLNDEPHELMSMEIDEEEEIQMIHFLDDENPSNVLLITYDFSQQKTISRVLNIKTESANKFQDLKREFEQKINLLRIIEKDMNSPHVQKPRMQNHNYFYSLDEQKADRILGNEKSYYPDLITNTQKTQAHNNTSFISSNSNQMTIDIKVTGEQHQNDSGSFLSSQDGQDYHGMYASHGLPSNKSSQSFSFKDQKIYEIFDFQEQIINDGFTKICYFNKDLRRKLMFTSNLKNQLFCFNIRQQIKAGQNSVSIGRGNDKSPKTPGQTRIYNNQSNNQSTSKQSFSSLSNQNQEIMVLQQPYVQKNTSPSKVQQGVSNTSQLPTTKIPKCVEYHDDKLYVIYKKLPHLDILQINGGILQRIKIDEILEREENLKLLKLRFIKFPLLQWSNRITNKPEFSQQIVKIIIVGTVQMPFEAKQMGIYKKQTQVKQFIMLFNIQKQTIEALKFLPILPKITCMSYGPYDNGYVLLGLESGMLFSLEFPSFNVFDQRQVFDGIYGGKFKSGARISCISCEPTRLIFVGGEDGQMIALSFVKEDVHYMYLDMGLRRYCTLKVNKKTKKFKEMSHLKKQQDESLNTFNLICS
ncbi:UNKNOWN [Stylonychia lemnae]|uniref:Uncharacterized protein n=1 Tax=Stylonychia lemnae TaxID=5949 RepID=A0A078APM4_STYLE|nr:UNKNOWN [Stylonychia lemnae]|eukprot:CDW84104.1 UNKNOWN [Stylonychia lemnae]